jgi:lipopolysaccharide transport system permease protein
MTAGDFTRAVRLTSSLTRHEISAQRKESFLGLAWIVLWPALQAGGFMMAFNLIRGDTSLSGPETILSTYLAVLIWSTASSVLISNLGILKANRETITQIVFPFSILSVVDVTVKYLVFLLQFLIAIAAWLIIVPNDHWYLVLAYLPIYLVAFYCALLAMAWIVSVFGVALPDLSFFLPPVLMLLLALSPVFQRNPETLPWLIRVMNEINPLSRWVEVLYSTLDISKTGPSAPVLFFAASILAVLIVRLLVRAAYREMAKVI